MLPDQKKNKSEAGIARLQKPFEKVKPIPEQSPGVTRAIVAEPPISPMVLGRQPTRNHTHTLVSGVLYPEVTHIEGEIQAEEVWVTADEAVALIREIPYLPEMYHGGQFVARRLELLEAQSREDGKTYRRLNERDKPIYSMQLVKSLIGRLTQRAAIVQQKAQEWVATYENQEDSSTAGNINYFSLVPLLQAEDEVDLAIIIEIGREAAEKIKTLDPQDPHSYDKSLRLTAEVVDGKAAHDHFVMANMRLVASIARKYIDHGVSLDDLIQEGNIGLMRALETWDYRQGYKFSTYATHWIFQKIVLAISEQSSTILVPVHTRNLIRQIQRFTDSFEQEFGRRPSIGEIARGLEKETEQIEAAIAVQTISFTQSLDAPLNDETDTELGELIMSQDALPEDEAFRQILKDDLGEALKKLPENLAEVLRLRFGLVDGRSHTFDEIGRRFGVSRESVRQLEYQARGLLQQSPIAKKLKDLLS